MTKEEMKEKVLAIKDPKKERYVIYQIGKELGLKLKPTNCGKCLRDYVNMLKEELGLIENASEQSDFNEVTESGYLFKPHKAVAWNGHIMNQDTPVEIIEQFVKVTGDRYYKKVEKPKPQPEPVVETIESQPVVEEETINNTELNTNENGN